MIRGDILICVSPTYHEAMTFFLVPLAFLFKLVMGLRLAILLRALEHMLVGLDSISVCIELSSVSPERSPRSSVKRWPADLAVPDSSPA